MKYSTLEDKIKSFVYKRIKFLNSEDGDYFEKCTEAYLIVHCIPISNFGEESKIDTDVFYGEEGYEIPLLGSYNGEKLDFIPTLEGILVTSCKDKNSCHRCTQLFRNGSVESRIPLNNEASALYIKDVEEKIKIFYNKLEMFYKEVNINTPIIVFINFINIKSYHLVLPNTPNRTSNPIKRSRLILPNLEIKEFNDNFEAKFNGIFSVLFNAFGEIKYK